MPATWRHIQDNCIIIIIIIIIIIVGRVAQVV